MAEPVEAELVTPAPPVVMGEVPAALVVRAATAAAVVRRSQVGKREEARVVVSWPEAGRQKDLECSKREHDVVLRYIETLNVRAVSVELGVNPRTVTKIVYGARFKPYIEYRVKLRGAAAGLTLDKIMAKLNGAIDGTDPLDEAQLAAVGHATRLLKPAAASLVFNQQNNFGGAGAAPAAASPYAKMGKDELLHEMREVVAEADGSSDEQAPSA